MAMVDVDGSCQFSASRLAWSEGWRPQHSVYIHQMKQVNSRNDFSHGDSIRNIVVVIIIIIIIIVKCSYHLYNTTLAVAAEHSEPCKNDRWGEAGHWGRLA